MFRWHLNFTIASFVVAPPNIIFKISAQTQPSKHKIKNSEFTPNAQLISLLHSQAAQHPLSYLLHFPIFHLASNLPLYHKDEGYSLGILRASNLLLLLLFLYLIVFYHRPLIPGPCPLEATAIPAAEASSFRLQYFLHYV
jgi:hypothetical protein